MNTEKAGQIEGATATHLLFVFHFPAVAMQTECFCRAPFPRARSKIQNPLKCLFSVRFVLADKKKLSDDEQVDALEKAGSKPGAEERVKREFLSYFKKVEDKITFGAQLEKVMIF